LVKFNLLVAFQYYPPELQFLKMYLAPLQKARIMDMLVHGRNNLLFG